MSSILTLELSDIWSEIKDAEHDKERLEIAINWIEKLFFKVENLIDNIYFNYSYGQLDEEFIREKDLLKRLRILKDVVDHKKIDVNDQLTKEIINLTHKVDSIDYFKIQDALNHYKSKDSPDFKIFEREFNAIKRSLTETFHKVCQLYLNSERIRYDESISFEKSKEFVQLLIKASRAGVKTGFDIGTMLEDVAKDLTLKSGIKVLGDINEKRVEKVKKKIAKELKEKEEKEKKNGEAE